MQWKGFVGGFVLAGVLGSVGAGWLAKQTEAMPIYWPSKTFYYDGDTRPELGYAAVSGTLTGEDMVGDTFVNIECRHDQSECRINELHQRQSPHGISIYNDAYPITLWTSETIVAESNPPATTCNRVKLIIVRASETAQYVRIPQPQADLTRCKPFAKKTFTWTIGDQFSVHE